MLAAVELQARALNPQKKASAFKFPLVAISLIFTRDFLVYVFQNLLKHQKNRNKLVSRKETKTQRKIDSQIVVLIGVHSWFCIPIFASLFLERSGRETNPSLRALRASA